MKIKYGFYAIITLVLMLSCDKNIEETPQKIALKNIDPKKYTKIECPFEIDMDTIKNEKIAVQLPIKNIGSEDLTNLYIKTTCDCTTLENYPSILKPKQSLNIKISIDISEKGYFCKTIFVYGSFNPLVRAVNIIGYRK